MVLGFGHGALRRRSIEVTDSSHLTQLVNSVEFQFEYISDWDTCFADRGLPSPTAIETEAGHCHVTVRMGRNKT